MILPEYINSNLIRGKKRIEDCHGGTFLLIMISFLPVLVIIMMLGVQLRNQAYTFKQARSDVQAFYTAEMGIERYKNEIKADAGYSGVLSFTKVIEGISYDVQVTSTRFGTPEKVKITSRITGTDVISERIITVSRITG